MTGRIILSATFVLATLCLTELSLSQPAPDVKPIEPLTEDRFIEGVDVPPSKPKSNQEAERSVEKSDQSGVPDEGKRAQASLKCDIPGALISSSSSVSGTSGDDDCGIKDPIMLEGVVVGDNAAKFPAPVTISCEFARKLTEWLREDVVPAAEDQFGSAVAVFRSGPGYQCRRRNNRPDGKLSEHALGKAVDISAFEIADGSLVSVSKDWGESTKKGRFLKTIHALACRRFTTVLGPDADPNHKSHFHVDIGCHGKTCTYLICQ